jgi:hypothetical protein
MALSVEGPADRVEQLITLTERLTELMAQDAADFEARRPHLAAARAEESSRLANLYRHESMRVKRSPDLIAGAPAGGASTSPARPKPWSASSAATPARWRR